MIVSGTVRGFEVVVLLGITVGVVREERDTFRFDICTDTLTSYCLSN